MTVIHNNRLRGRYKGIVRIYRTSGSYGFITDDLGHDIYFHISNVINYDKSPILSGDLVEFETLRRNDKGFTAGNVYLVRNL